MLVKIEKRTMSANANGRQVRLPSTWAETVGTGTELELYVDSLTGALVIPDPSKPINPETGEPLAADASANGDGK